jgi:hypothetical protein
MFSKKNKEEIYGIFSIIILFILSSDKELLSYIDNNYYIKISIFLVSLFIVYKKIEWQYIIILIIFFAVFFSNFVNIIKKIVLDIKNDIKTSLPENKNKDFSHLGQKVLSLINEDKKGILKKVRFEEEDDEMCDKVSKQFGLNDDPESEPETDGEDAEELKNTLNDYVKNLN